MGRVILNICLALYFCTWGPTHIASYEPVPSHPSVAPPRGMPVHYDGFSHCSRPASPALGGYQLFRSRWCDPAELKSEGPARLSLAHQAWAVTSPGWSCNKHSGLWAQHPMLGPMLEGSAAATHPLASPTVLGWPLAWTSNLGRVWGLSSKLHCPQAPEWTQISPTGKVLLTTPFYNPTQPQTFQSRTSPSPL